MQNNYSFHLVRISSDSWILKGVDADGIETDYFLVFYDGTEALNAYITWNGFTDIVPNDILYYLEAV